MRRLSILLLCCLFSVPGLIGNANPSISKSNASSVLRSVTWTGVATWYSMESILADYKMRHQPLPKDGIFLTASGTRFADSAMICALPADLTKALNMKFGCAIKITNLANGRTVVVKYLDRGPGRKARSRGVIIDLPPAAFETIGELRQGRIKVKVEEI